MGPTPTGDEGRVSGATPPPANRVGELREDQAAAQVIATRFDDTPDRPAPPRMRARCRWPGHRMPVRPGGAHARISAIRDAIAAASAVVNGANSGLPSMRWNPASISGAARRDSPGNPPRAGTGQQRSDIVSEVADLAVPLSAPYRRRQFNRQRADQDAERREIAGA